MTAAQEAPARGDAATAFKRVLLKLSGEALMGEREFGLDAGRIEAIAAEIVDVQQRGLEIAIVTGGGNIWRGMAAAADCRKCQHTEYRIKEPAAGMASQLTSSSGDHPHDERKYRQWP